MSWSAAAWRLLYGASKVTPTRASEQNMGSRNRSLGSRISSAGALLVGASILLPVAAQAQARGTLQVFAQVVDTKVSSDGLLAGKAALKRGLSPSASAQQGAVPTLARVSVAYAPEQRPVVVLTIDYSSN